MTSQAELSRALWKASDALRGVFSATEVRSILLVLLVLKRSSDEHAKTHGPDSVPVAALWSALAANHVGLLPTMQRLLRSSGSDIFSESTSVGLELPVHVDDDRRQEADMALRQVIAILSEVTFSPKRKAPSADTLEAAITDFLDALDDVRLRPGGPTGLPPYIARFVVSLVNPQPGETVCDPTCGTGSLLLESARHLRDLGEAAPQVWGQERDLTLRNQALMLLALHGPVSGQISSGDVLLEPRPIREDGQPMRFDCIVSCPPFSERRPRDRGLLQSDPWNRFPFDLPPGGPLDFAYIQHGLSVLTDSGRLAMVIPLGPLFRGGTENAIRSELVARDLVEAVVEMPSNVLRTTTIPSASLVLNRNKNESRRGLILFVDASSRTLRDGRRTRISPEATSETIASFRSFSELDGGFSRRVDIGEVANNDYSLVPARYLTRQIDPALELDIDAALASLRRAEVARSVAADQVAKLAERRVLSVAGVTKTLGELVVARGLTQGRAVGGPVGGITDAIPVMTPRHLRGGGIKDPSTFVPRGTSERFAEDELEEGDVVAAWSGSELVSNVVRGDQARWVVGKGCLRIRLQRGVDPQFIAHMLSSGLLESQAVIPGTSRMSLSPSRMAEIELSLPSLEEQKRIVAVWEAIEARVVATTGEIEQLRLFKRSTMAQFTGRSGSSNV